jgi:hypothetical protein
MLKYFSFLQIKYCSTVAHLILLHLMKNKSHEAPHYENLWSSVHSSPLGPNILLSTLFPNPLNL